jgi:hypothetical protein
MSADMSPRELHHARRYYAALKELFVQHAGGCADPQALRRASVLCRALKTLVEEQECQRQLAVIEECAPAYFSEREHLDWRLGSLPGDQFLRMHIFRALVLFHSRVNRMEATRRIDEVLPGLLAQVEAELDALEKAR